MCDACTTAAANPHTGHFTAGCFQCSARMLAHSPEYHETRAQGKPSERYKQALLRVFGDRWKEGAAEVKRWGEKLKGQG